MVYCTRCHGTLKFTHVDEDYQVDRGHILIKGVPAYRCTICGQREYDPEVLNRISSIINSVREDQATTQTMEVQYRD